MPKKLSLRGVDPLFGRLVTILEAAQTQVVRTVNSAMVLAYWHIGRELVEFVQRGAARADYGEEVLETLARRLEERFGRGYSTTNLRNFRRFYQAFADRPPQIRHMPCAESGGVDGGFSSQLGWSHYRALMAVEQAPARAFYEIEAERDSWSVAHLERQIHTQLFARLLKSRNKAGVLDLARRGQALERPVDVMKSPVVLDFLELPDREILHESDLETAILGKLSQFLLELGRGFAFVARQKRLTFETDEFYVDLVFYNVILKCFLLIDLKLGKLAHQDIGQMDTYVRLFDAQGRTHGDGPTIGLVLCAEKNEAIARYSILHEHRQLFAAKYVTYLPTVEELQRELAREAGLTPSRSRGSRRRPPRRAPRPR